MPKDEAEDMDEVAERLEHGWLRGDKFTCDGCAVREGHEHRCCRDDGVWADSRQVCTCPEPGCHGHVVTWEVVGMNLAPPRTVTLRSNDGRERSVPAVLPIEVPSV
jgi:hypothetical protein